MPTRTKFTAARRARLLELLGAGASRRTACRASGISHGTLSRWLERGRKTPEGRYGEFLTQVEQAEASPILRALTQVYEALPDYPELAWRFLERTEEGFCPRRPVEEIELPTRIQLTFEPAHLARPEDRPRALSTPAAAADRGPDPSTRTPIGHLGDPQSRSTLGPIRGPQGGLHAHHPTDQDGAPGRL